jgi:hypothetical protein
MPGKTVDQFMFGASWSETPLATLISQVLQIEREVCSLVSRIDGAGSGMNPSYVKTAFGRDG